MNVGNVAHAVCAVAIATGWSLEYVVGLTAQQVQGLLRADVDRTAAVWGGKVEDAPRKRSNGPRARPDIEASTKAFEDSLNALKRETGRTTFGVAEVALGGTG